MGPEYALGSYVSLPYFQTVDTPQNKTFVEAFKAYAGADAVTHAAMEAVYIGVNFWKMAVEKAGSQLPSGIGKVTEIAMISAMMPMTRSPRRRQNGQ